ncbi:aminoglycoside phosphotransferase family protein [Nocardioides zeae]|uniref:Aminoglycoside phosphotransferase family protein n=1 Tax=Nocardioides zeae TaxID=1457234 RepID=A0A6P0HGW8_9ACTN|nr:aminoglycoside phosphotransferase family protein [Nocardioides zeae]NEN77932.1 aminoglycoside phosphotransferase family protein [Nocardioides zeae]
MRPAERVIERRGLPELGVPDLGVPGLDVLLGDGLADLLGTDDLTRLRLRVKAGTSAALAVRRGSDHLVVLAAAGHARPKLAKSHARAARLGAVVAADPGAGVLATYLVGDRDLPGLRRLPADAVVLSANPQRRVVARVEGPDGPAVLRVVRPSAHAAALRGPRALAGRAGTPRLLAADARRGMLTTSWVPGRPLDGAPDARALRPAGAAVADLHGTATGLPLEERPLRALAQARDQLALLLPTEAGRIAALAARAAQALHDAPLGPVVTLHGDLSRDQLVLDGSPDTPRIGVLDLDRARRGEAADDLGNLLADDVVRGQVRGQVQGREHADLLAGYAAVRPLPDPAALRAWTAGHLLRRAVEPFRTCAPDWRSTTTALLTTLEDLC